MQQARRNFLRAAGVAGATFAGGVAVPGALHVRQATLNPAPERCNFDALPTDFIYLNTGTEGSMPDCVLANLRNGLQQWASNPTASYELDPVLGKPQRQNRESAARFLDVGMDNICLTDNTTMGLSMTLLGLNFRDGDKVITTNHEHNAIKSPLHLLQQRNGLRVLSQPFPPSSVLKSMCASELIDALFPDTPALRGAAALCVSHVYPTTGVRLPLQALRNKANALDIRYLIVDGAQALGMIDLSNAGDSISNSDFYAAPGHKWLNGPPSTGLLYIRDADIHPPEFYPTNSQRATEYLACDSRAHSCYPIAEALQIRGCSNTPGFAAMIRAMRYVEDAGGSAAVEDHILKLSNAIKTVFLTRAPNCIVSPHTDPKLSSGITTFFPFRWDKPEISFTDKKTVDWVVAALLLENIQVRSIGFWDTRTSDGVAEANYAIRISTGYLNTADQLSLFRDALRDVLMRIR